MGMPMCEVCQSDARVKCKRDSERPVPDLWDGLVWRARAGALANHALRGHG